MAVLYLTGLFNPWDVYPLIPCYNGLVQPKEAWVQLVCTLCYLDHKTFRGSQASLACSLLEYFPHPSAGNWFPSWDQVEHFPNISIRRPAIPDDQIDLHSVYSLKLTDCGIIYLPCRLYPYGPGTYRAVGLDENGGQSTAVLHNRAWGADAEEFRVLVDQQYVLVAVKLDDSLRLLNHSKMYSLRFIVLVCRELCSWPGTGHGLSGMQWVQSIYNRPTHLRRVTSLHHTADYSWGFGNGSMPEGHTGIPQVETEGLGQPLPLQSYSEPWLTAEITSGIRARQPRPVRVYIH